MKLRTLGAIVLVLLLGTVSPVFSAGFHIHEQGIKAMGMGNAFTAQADDPSALFYNPAGIAFQKGAQFSLGTLIINVPETEFSGTVHNVGKSPEIDQQLPAPISGYEWEVSGEEARKDIFFPPHLYVFKTLEDLPLSFGIATNSLFPLAKRWDTNSALASVTKEIAIKPFNIQPTVAYRIDPLNLSLAAGIDYTYATVWLESVKYADAVITKTVGPGVDAIPVGAAEIEGDGDGWGYNFGILWKPLETVSVGLSYRSEIDLDFEDGDVDFISADPTRTFSASASTDITLPDMWSLGVAFKPTSRFTAEVNVDRTGWSSYDRLAIEFDNGAPGLDRNKNWDDVYAYRIGVQYCLTDHFDLRLGYTYDETPVPEETLGPELPDADRNDYSVGFGYKDTWGSIDLAYMFVDFEDRTVNNDIQSGTYKSEAHLFGSSVTVKF